MSRFSDFWRHTAALTVKEVRQIVRDKSAFLLGIVMPVTLILLFGYGITFDIRDVRLAVADEARTGESTAVAADLVYNPILKVTPVKTRAEGEALLKDFTVEGLLVMKLSDGALTESLTVDGIDATRAVMVGNAVTGALGVIAAKSQTAAGVTVTPRIWFNESAESRWYLVPGLMVVVLTLTGMMLTGLVLAREWERGTMEAMMATPVSPLAFLISKTVPYFVLGMTGWGLCFAAGVFLYDVPVRGSATIVTASSVLYLLMGLGLGLFISGKTRSQFLASQVTVLAGFLPAVILSGFIFDLRSAPAWANVIAHLFPPVYYMELLRVGFLTGGMESLVIRDFAVLTGFAAVFLSLAYRMCVKRIRR